MKILKVETKKDLNKFLKVPDMIYKGDKNFVPYMRADIKKVLNKLVLMEKSYTALIVLENKKAVARILYTVGKNKQFTELCDSGFFAMFESVDDQQVANLILGEMVDDLKSKEVKHVEGTYFPYDQDNRRGILIDGFDTTPVLLTSYNKRYYQTLLENFGMTKDFDSFAYAMTEKTIPIDRYRRISEMAIKRFDYRIEHADMKQIDTLIEEVSHVMEEASTDEVYQDAPTADALRVIVKSWKRFLKSRYIQLARRNSDNKLIGVVVAVPDFNQVFKRMKGSMNPLALLKMLCFKNKISTVRGMMQYVLPEYQNKGTVLSLYISLFDACFPYGIKLIEASSMMENNKKPNEAIVSAGGVKYKTYRLFGMDII